MIFNVYSLSVLQVHNAPRDTKVTHFVLTSKSCRFFFALRAYLPAVTCLPGFRKSLILCCRPQPLLLPSLYMWCRAYR